MSTPLSTSVFSQFVSDLEAHFLVRTRTTQEELGQYIGRTRLMLETPVDRERFNYFLSRMVADSPYLVESVMWEWAERDLVVRGITLVHHRSL